ncbi:hypothetical protein I302_106181 [Kwoniella bestiolae CBS 10118]|uniref:Uncharacterized protein n=1 Tax=Kwoniella bestiolae CBS 10118 TaxID=1296100 RepID=A0A1B9G394_9TREE|nr:hypothetical protein I302_05305 [Kwoniella bestiolae CBS 10118]OCF25485.1 hypothetical protein I302_05305 [Kwoniella bestiolae CBS 10118]
MKPPDPSSLENLSHPTLTTLLHLSQSHQILFRLHTPTSISPLIWTGELQTSGFSSPNIHLSSLTPKSYRPFLKYSRSASGRGLAAQERVSPVSYNVTPGPYLRHTIVDHILIKSKQTCIPDIPTIEERREGVWPDERTPWISGAEDLFWVIWEVARRLAVLQGTLVWVGGVQMALVKHPMSHQNPEDWNEGRGNKDEGDLIGTRSEDERKNENEELAPPREIWLRPTDVLSPSTYPGEMSLSLQESYGISKKAAAQSSEILFFGRIWAENVLSNLEWTCEDTPFDLPPHLFAPSNEPLSHAQNQRDPKSRKTEPNRRERWIDNLIWDPKIDNYLIALEKVMSRRREESRSRGEWPIGPL